MGLALALTMNSCMQEETTPQMMEEKLPVVETIADLVSGSENFRTIPTSYNYFEEFENQLFYVNIGLEAPQGLYPGTGEGSATRFGKGNGSLSFINQLATFDENYNLVTTGSPVTEIFGEDLANLGLYDIPDAVSSITTDGKGNAVWFENVENITNPVSADRVEFVAKIKIIGGNGRFSKAYGEGVVEGYFDPNTGKGKSTTSARINF